MLTIPRTASTYIFIRHVGHCVRRLGGGTCAEAAVQRAGAEGGTVRTLHHPGVREDDPPPTHPNKPAEGVQWKDAVRYMDHR